MKVAILIELDDASTHSNLSAWQRSQGSRNPYGAGGCVDATSAELIKAAQGAGEVAILIELDDASTPALNNSANPGHH